MPNHLYNIRMKNLFIIVFCTFISFPVLAQEEEGQNIQQEEQIFPDSAVVPAEQTKKEHRNTVTNIPGSTIIEDKHAENYLLPTVENISKLYWLKGKLKFENNKALDNFVFINECELYKKHINDDFMWLKVRKAVESMITEKLPTYSDKFKIIVPIDLGRYDFEKKGFSLVNKTAFQDLRRVEVGGNYQTICGDDSEIEAYPRNVVLILNEPFNYDFLPINEHLAQAYILRNNKSLPELPGVFGMGNKTFNRLAFARVRMTFLEYQGSTKKDTYMSAAMMFGTIDGIDVFEYADETGLLSSVDF